MSYKPTGYPTGRPRKGEVRPVTAKMIRQRRYRENNLEDVLERNRIAHEKFRREQPERWAEIQRGVRERAKQWANGVRVRGTGRVTKKIRITVTWD